MVQMPALNTPQFDWTRSRLPHKAQPVPPIYQPEVAAEAIYYAALHPKRREYFVGETTPVVIEGNKVAPWLGDLYLANTGYEAQQTAVPETHDRRDNVYRPFPGDYAAHGRFDDVARDFSPQVWASTHRRGLALLATAAAAAVGLGMMAAGSRSPAHA
jgi:hypothetical protein